VQLRTPKKAGAIQVLQLTVDHKPELVEEKKRIVSSGGRVDMVHGCGRVYLATEDVPGLAMSRSLGDYVAHDAGVSSTPDIYDYDLTGLPGVAPVRSGDFLRVSLLVATDGVFDVMSNEDAVATALQHWEKPGAAVDEILAVTDTTWRTKWNVVDDTSVCVVNIECQ
jgi:serine/threonine protein phosphatase PrpC